MKVYKLTDKDGKTRNNTQWGENITHEVPKLGRLCSYECLHFYFSPLLAVLMNPVHVNIINPLLWEAEAEEPIIRDAFKGGTKKLTTIKKIGLPVFSLNQRTYFAILCAKEVCKEEKWNIWADKWIEGKDRSHTSAAYAAYASAYAASAYDAASAAYASSYDAAYAAYASAYAATSATINFESLAEKAFNWKE